MAEEELDEDKACDQKCKDLGYAFGICKYFAVSPEGFKAREEFEKTNIGIGYTAGCEPPHVDGIGGHCYCLKVERTETEESGIIENEITICEINEEYESTLIEPIGCQCPQGYKFEVVRMDWGPCPPEASGITDCPMSVLKCVKK